MKLLTNFANVFWNPPQNSLHCDWPMFSNVRLPIGFRENAPKFTRHRAASCMRF